MYRRVKPEHGSSLLTNISWTHIIFALLIGGIGWICLLATVPQVNRDALTHHLFVPKLYLLSSGIQKLPNIVFSYYPINLDLMTSSTNLSTLRLPWWPGS